MMHRLFARVMSMWALLALSGCFTTRIEPLRPLTVTLSSTAPVHLTTVGSDGMVETSRCPSLNAVLAVAQLRGDTLFYETITTQREAPRGEPCHRNAPGYIILAEHPSLTMLHVRRSAQRSALWGFAVYALVASAIFLARAQ